MSRKVLIALFAAALLVVPVTEAALAYTHLNSSKSNIYRNKHVTGTKQHGTNRTTTIKSSKSNTSDRMGGGGGKSAAARATTVKSSKSNTSDRAINLNSSRSNRY